MIKVNKLLINKRTFQLGPIDLEFQDGYVYAITGNSGSGKTLFLQTLLGGIFLEKNVITYNNLNFHENNVDIKKLYSYVADRPLFSDSLRVAEVLYKIYKLDERFNLEKCFEFLSKHKVYRHKKIYELSQGERKILLFSIGFFTKTKLLVLDNPFSGVGLIARKEMIALLREYMDEDKTIIIVTEEPYVIQNLADYIIVFENGQVTSKEDVVELQERFETNDIERILLSLLKGENKND
ncbi:ATP-binding cassette domain-containing protein [Gemella haemolysans]|uniref:ATP-binding cassette domain-containing protein n=1 Tax=Gemella haemolysans TaxID=1379 RepID=A0AAW6B2F8_9BACL|nr:ATP-binding cassette domain-containing protein [Gemella haemolysans]MDB6185396.1 ATP-binding cassette domain-containing protein [Gemella haemolysans]